MKMGDTRALLLREFATNLAGAGPDEKNLIHAAADSCRKLLKARQCSVWLPDSREQKLILKAASGYMNMARDHVGALAYPIKEITDGPVGITAWIYLNQKPVSADSYTELKSKPGHRGRFDAEVYGILKNREHMNDEDHPVQQFYGGPISLGEERFGVLKVEIKEEADENGRFRFSEADKAALDTVAAILAMALKHARTVIESQERLQHHYGFTVHSIRNEMVPISGGVKLQSDICKEHPELEDKLSHSSRLLKLGIDGLRFYINNLLKFFHAKIEMEEVSMSKIISDEKWLMSEIATPRELKIRLDDKDAKTLETYPVRGDSVFLSAAVKEILRNAWKAIYRRREDEKRDEIPQTKGKIDIGIKSTADRLLMSFSDNGDAVRNSEAREKLIQFRNNLYNKEKKLELGRYGLQFIEWVMAQHGGELDLKVDEEKTTFTLSLPISRQKNEG